MKSITTLPAFSSYAWKVMAKNGTNNWGDWSTERVVHYKPPENLTQNKNKQPFSDEPVNTATGAYNYSHQDFIIPGRGLPFEFARFYNSKATCSTAMGNKWKHTYLISLEEDLGDGSVVIHWADCTDDYYSPIGSGQYENAHFGYSGKLIKNGDGSFDFTTKSLIIYHFDNSGRLLTISDRNENTLTLNYTGNNIDSITDTVGRTITFSYDGNNKLISITDPLSRTIEFTYDLNGNLSTYTDARANTITYFYDGNHNLTHIIDKLSNPLVTNVYTDNKVTQQTNARSFVWDFNYTPEGINTEINPLSGVITYKYNENSWIEQITDPNGNSEKYTYDSNGNRIEVINKRGKKTSYTCDSHCNVLTITNALGDVTTFEYNSNDQVTKITDALERETLFQYDSKGNLTRITRPLGQVTEFEYDSYGQLIKITDPLVNETAYGYDTQGNRTSITNALTHTTQFTYDDVGRLLSIIEPNTETITYTYDENDNLKTTTDQDVHLTQYNYDANDNRIGIINPRTFTTTFSYNENNMVESITDDYSNSIIYTYDELDRMTMLTDRRGEEFDFTYDAVGNRISSNDANDETTYYSYDAVGNLSIVRNANSHYSYFIYDDLDRLIQVIDSMGNCTEYEYDAVGRLISMTDANGNVTTYEYDDLDRLTKVTDSLYGTAKYTYDLNGNRTSITDPNGHLTIFTYDELNRVFSETDPLGNTVSYSYDELGNLSSRTDGRANITNYYYYDTHWLQTVSYPDASFVSFLYDDNGNRTQMTDSVGTTQYAYDNLDRTTQVTDPFGNIIGYGYDESSNRTSIDYDAVTPGVKVVQYTFDGNGRLASLTDWATHTFNYSYDPVGNIIELAYPNGCKEKRTYYPNERLYKLWHENPDETKFIEYTYYYDNVGNITGMDRKEAVEREFTAESVFYTYNAANEITSANTDTFTFDEDGNQREHTSDSETTNYSFDYENHLTQLDPPGTDLYQFTYNGAGDRLNSVENGATKRYLLDSNKPLTDVLADMDASNAIQQYYLYGIGLVARIDPSSGDIFYYHPDHLGSIMAVTDNSNSITAAFTYDEFGAIASSIGSEEGPWRYCGDLGAQFPQNNKLFLRNRFVNNIIGRFLSEDSIIFNVCSTQGINSYLYVQNNPMKMVDPSGLVIEIIGSVNFQKEVNTLINKIRQSSTGDLLVGFLESQSVGVTTIKEGSAYQFNQITGDVEIFTNEEGIPSKQSISELSYTIPGILEVKGIEYPPEISLAHELIHAMDYKMGKLDHSLGPDGVSMKEVHAVRGQNTILKELNYSKYKYLRRSYDTKYIRSHNFNIDIASEIMAYFNSDINTSNSGRSKSDQASIILGSPINWTTAGSTPTTSTPMFSY